MQGKARQFCRSLDPDQDQENVRPDLDPNCLALIEASLFEKLMETYPACKA